METIPLLSIIVPVYNTELYIEDCIYSILKQPYEKIEVLLIDDGSSDFSGALCDRLALLDCRIKVIHKTNGGLSSARNTGVSYAKGKYIMFLDSDDYWDDRIDLMKYVNALELNSSFDFVGFKFKYLYVKSGKEGFVADYTSAILESIKKEDRIYNMALNGSFPMSSCIKVIRSSFIKCNNISFPLGTTAEDIPWFFEILYKSENFSLYNDSVYIYRKGVETSISSSVDEKKVLDLYRIFTNQLERISAYSKNDQKVYYSFLSYIYVILLAMANSLTINRLEYIEELKKYTYVLKFNMHPKVKIVNIIYGLIGYKYTLKLLSCYLFSRLN